MILLLKNLFDNFPWLMRTIPSTGTNATSTSPTTATITITASKAEEQSQNSPPPIKASLKLKCAKETPHKKANNRHIHWSEDTVDNENLNKKKSNSNQSFKIIRVDNFCVF